MRLPRQLLFSLGIGALLGFTLLAGIFSLVSFTRPGWLRTFFAPGTTQEVEEPLLLPLTPINTSTDPTPTVPPLVADPSASCSGPEHLVIALLGIDDRDMDYDTPTRTDAITLVNLNFKDHSVALFSIPRDLYVPLPNLEQVRIDQSRINTAYVYGEVYGVPGGGPAEFKETVELNFGIRVERYVMVNFNAFVETVDTLGGVDIEVPKAIHDPTFPADEGSGFYPLDIPAGTQHFDGAMALRYARTRHQDDDYNRVKRQQQVLLAVYDRLLRPESVTKIPALLNTMQNSIRTDLSTQEWAMLACLGPQIDRSAMTTYSIDGTMVIPWRTPTGGSVSIPNREAIAPIVTEFLGE